MDKIISTVNKYRNLILETEEFVWEHAETGYKEFETSNFLAKQFEKLGYKLNYADGITGFYTRIETGKVGPEILILAELDSIICQTHKSANSTTGAVHSCGHNAQCAALVGIAAALTEPEIKEKLCGNIRLCVVPAEELLEIEYRKKLKEQGIIKYFGGKCEFLHRGYFDGVDIAFMVHTSSYFHVMKGGVGCLVKNVIYKGVASHAGGSPWNGKNALYAATCGINAVNAIRETFKESDIIRFHPIITNGGQMVNAIPETATIETYVRGSSFEAISFNNKRINQALIGAAYSLDNNIEIIDIPGYSPLVNDENMVMLTKEAADLVIPHRNFEISSNISSGSTDMGDLSCIMPVVHPYVGGARGKVHGNDYEIYDKEAACIDSAKMQLTMLNLLLKDNAERAYKIIKEFKPRFKSKEDFLAFQDSLNVSGDRITYREDGNAEIKC